MKHLNLLFPLLICGFLGNLQSQDTRYVDEIFTDINIQSDVVYATNISPLTGGQDTIPLLMDIIPPLGMRTLNVRPLFTFLVAIFFPPFLTLELLEASWTLPS